MFSIRICLALLALAPLLWAANAEACGRSECVRWVDVGPLSYDAGPAPSTASPAASKAEPATLEPQDAGHPAHVLRCLEWRYVGYTDTGCATAAGAPLTLAAAAWLLRRRRARASEGPGGRNAST